MQSDILGASRATRDGPEILLLARWHLDRPGTRSAGSSRSPTPNICSNECIYEYPIGLRHSNRDIHWISGRMLQLLVNLIGFVQSPYCTIDLFEFIEIIPYPACTASKTESHNTPSTNLPSLTFSGCQIAKSITFCSVSRQKDASKFQTWCRHIYFETMVSIT